MKSSRGPEWACVSLATARATATVAGARVIVTGLGRVARGGARSEHGRGVGIRARTRAALAVKKARGERTGGVPMGRVAAGDGRLAVEAREAAAVARARDLRAQGRSLRAIAAVLTAEGHRPRGTRWHVETLARLTRTA